MDAAELLVTCTWQSAAYFGVRVLASQMVALLECLGGHDALDRLGLQPSGRSVVTKLGGAVRIGGEVLLSRVITHSGAHCDADSGLLIVLAGTRTVWWAEEKEFNSAATRVKKESRALREDPADAKIANCVWHREELLPGDAMLRPVKIWHSIRASPGSVAVSVSVAVSGGGSDVGLPRRGVRAC